MLDNSRKISKLSSILLSLSADYFKSKSDFKPGIVTVTGVDISPDKSYTTVWVSLINVQEDKFVKLTPHLQKELRKFISQNQKFRYTPHIKIQIDNSAEEIQKIDRLLKE